MQVGFYVSVLYGRFVTRIQNIRPGRVCSLSRTQVCLSVFPSFIVQGSKYMDQKILKYMHMIILLFRAVKWRPRALHRGRVLGRVQLENCRRQYMDGAYAQA
jgi:hypothetical protein